MREETKDTIACILIFAIPVILLVSFAVYMFFHPKIRGISYCDDNRYYMVNSFFVSVLDRTNNFFITQKLHLLSSELH